MQITTETVKMGKQMLSIYAGKLRVKTHHTEEEAEAFAIRAQGFMEKRPYASLTRVAQYTGVGVHLLREIAKKYNFTLPEIRDKAKKSIKALKLIRGLKNNWR